MLRFSRIIRPRRLASVRYASSSVVQQIDDFLREEGLQVDTITGAVQHLSTNFADYNLGIHKFTNIFWPVHWLQMPLDFCLNVLHLDCFLALVTSHFLLRLLASKLFLQPEIDAEGKVKEGERTGKLQQSANLLSAVPNPQEMYLGFQNAMADMTKGMSSKTFSSLDRSNLRLNVSALKMKESRDQMYAMSKLTDYNPMRDNDPKLTDRQNRWTGGYMVIVPMIQKVFSPIFSQMKGGAAQTGAKVATFTVPMMAYRKVCNKDYPLESHFPFGETIGNSVFQNGGSGVYDLAKSDASGYLPLTIAVVQGSSLFWQFKDSGMTVLREMRLPICIAAGSLLYWVIKDREVFLSLALAINCAVTIGLKKYARTSYFRNKYNMMSYSQQLALVQAQRKKHESRENDFRGVKNSELPDDLRKPEQSIMENITRVASFSDTAKLQEGRRNEAQRDLANDTKVALIKAENDGVSVQDFEQLHQYQRSWKWKYLIKKTRPEHDRKIFFMKHQKGRKTLLAEKRQEIIATRLKRESKAVELDPETDSDGTSKEQLYPLTNLNFPKTVPDYEMYDQKHNIRRKFYI